MIKATYRTQVPWEETTYHQIILNRFLTESATGYPIRLVEVVRQSCHTVLLSINWSKSGYLGYTENRLKERATGSF